MRKKNRGFILITTLILAVILFIVCATFSTIVKQDAQKIKAQEYNIIAHYVAEGGVQYIKAEMCAGKIPSTYTASTKEIYDNKSVKGSFNVIFDNNSLGQSYLNYPDYDSTGTKYALAGDTNKYYYLYKIICTSEIKINSVVLARKTIKAEIATTLTIANSLPATGYIYREYEKYR